MMSCRTQPVSRQDDTVPDAYAEPMVGVGPPPQAREAREVREARKARKARKGGSAGPDELRDAALHEEIELVGQLVVAATATAHRLSQTQIDRVLGIEDECDPTPVRAVGRHD